MSKQDAKREKARLAYEALLNPPPKATIFHALSMDEKKAYIANTAPGHFYAGEMVFSPSPASLPAWRGGHSPPAHAPRPGAPSWTAPRIARGHAALDAAYNALMDAEQQKRRPRRALTPEKTGLKSKIWDTTLYGEHLCNGMTPTKWGGAPQDADLFAVPPYDRLRPHVPRAMTAGAPIGRSTSDFAIARNHRGELTQMRNGIESRDITFGGPPQMMR